MSPYPDFKRVNVSYLLLWSSKHEHDRLHRRGVPRWKTDGSLLRSGNRTETDQFDWRNVGRLSAHIVRRWIFWITIGPATKAVYAHSFLKHRFYPFSGQHPEIQRGCFQMTLFVAAYIVWHNFMPTFKIQGYISSFGRGAVTTTECRSPILLFHVGNSNVKVNQCYSPQSDNEVGHCQRITNISSSEQLLIDKIIQNASDRMLQS